MTKTAYPQDEYAKMIEPPRNLTKWTQTMRELYDQAQRGMDFKRAFDSVTHQWDDMEKLDFKHWLNFYQENAHQKYKSAQYSHLNNGGATIPTKALRSVLPQMPDMNGLAPAVEVENQRVESERKAIVQKKIQALISRLNSAEKISTQPEVQLALQKVLSIGVEQWVSLLQQLKREIQLAPMRGYSSQTLEDLIYKNANRLRVIGKDQAATFLIKFAQLGTPMPTNSMDVVNMNPIDVPMGGQPVMPSFKEDAPGPTVGLPGAAPSSAAAPTGPMAEPMEAQPEEENPILKKFLELLAGPNEDSNKADMDLQEPNDQLVVSEEDFDDLKIVRAQAIPMDSPKPLRDSIQAPVPLAAPNQIPQEAPLVEEEELVLPEEELVSPEEESIPEMSDKKVDPFDAALTSVTMSDLISLLESVANVFRARELPRSLTKADLMMSQLGLSSFFPSLGDAIKSALESNSYCSTRVEDILSKLKGTMLSPMNIDLGGDEVGKIKSNLARQDEMEKAKKEKRRLQNLQDEVSPPAEEITQVPEEIAQAPAQIKTAPPVRPELPQPVIGPPPGNV